MNVMQLQVNNDIYTWLCPLFTNDKCFLWLHSLKTRNYKLMICTYSDIKVVLQLELFQTAQRLQSGDIFHLIVAEVQVEKRR